MLGEPGAHSRAQHEHASTDPAGRPGRLGRCRLTPPCTREQGNEAGTGEHAAALSLGRRAKTHVMRWGSATASVTLGSQPLLLP